MTRYGIFSSLPISRKVQRSATNIKEKQRISQTEDQAGVTQPKKDIGTISFSACSESTESAKILCNTNSVNVFVEQPWKFSEIVDSRKSDLVDDVTTDRKIPLIRNVQQVKLKESVLAADFLCDDEEYNLTS